MRLAVLGAGPGGYVAAIRAAQLGAEVTVVEKSEVGGTCLNWGCIPTKTLIASCELLAAARKSESFGIDIRGEILPNISKMMERKNRVVETLVKGIRALFKSRGITIIEGEGTLTSPHEMSVALRSGETRNLLFDRLIIATGARPREIAAAKFDAGSIISSEDALGLSVIPKRIVIIGAGIIGCEYANIFGSVGSEVTLIEKLPRVLATEDTEISALFERELKKRKIKLRTNTVVEKVGVRAGGIYVSLPGGEEVVAEKALVAVGRDFNTKGIGLEAAGVAKAASGEIKVNRAMETNIPGIYAVGDVTGGMMLAHVASRQGIIAARNIMGKNDKIDYTSVPSAIFTSPEIASVGLREFETAEKGIKVRVGHFPFRLLGKAHAMGEIEGIVKIISDFKSDRILGVHIMGPRASDLIHEATLAIRKGLKTKDISETIHAHPTLSEALKEAAEDVHGEAIHLGAREVLK
jgi:dihydrolipoamide dehydrogenase